MRTSASTPTLRPRTSTSSLGARRPQATATRSATPTPAPTTATTLMGAPPQPRNSAVLPLDTRVFQPLEPLPLPATLRDRVARAQRRLAAEKDGLSLFTSTSNSTSTSATLSTDKDRDKEKDRSKERDTQWPRRSVVGAMMAMDSNDEELSRRRTMHLPDVVLAHKMREFEAQAHSAVPLGGADPLQSALLPPLSVEEQEAVALAMQTRIRALAADADAQVVRVQRQLDARGVFDAAANAQRARALGLVALSRRCRLEQIRDEAIREVLGHEGGGVRVGEERTDDGRGGAGAGAGGGEEVDGGRQGSGGEASGLSASGTLAKQRRQHQPLHRRRGTLTTERARVIAASSIGAVSRPRSNQVEDAHNRGPDEAAVIRSSGKRGGHGNGNDKSKIKGDSDVGAAVGHVGSSEAAAAPQSRLEEMLSRHPHILGVLQQLGGSGGGNGSSTHTEEPHVDTEEVALTTTAEEDTKTRIPLEQWADRSRSYRIIAARVSDSLRARCQRWRWDATCHWKLETGLATGSIALSSVLLARVRQSRMTATARRNQLALEEAKALAEVQESSADRHQRLTSAYQALQDRIQTRRQLPPSTAVSLRRHGTSGVGMRASTTTPTPGPQPQSQPQPQPKPHPTESCPALDTPSSSPSPRSLRPLSRSSVSTPLLEYALASGSTLTGTTPDEAEARRRSQLERSLPVLMRQQRRHTRIRSRGALIGAPVVVHADTPGHHSNARMEARRQSAQTWSWLPRLDATSDGGPVKRRKRRKGKKTMAAVEEGDEEEEGAEEGDDEGSDDQDHDDSVDGSEGQEEIDDDGDDDDDDEDGDDGDDRGSENEDSASGTNQQRGADSDGVLGTARSSASSSAASHLVSIDTARSNASSRRSRTSRSAKSRRSSPSRRRRQRLNAAAALVTLTNAQRLQQRLEALWQSLEMPFAQRLQMLETWAVASEGSGGDALPHALVLWEHAAVLANIHEKMRRLLSRHRSTGEDNDKSQNSTQYTEPELAADASLVLTEDDWAFLSTQLLIDVPLNAVHMPLAQLLQWIRAHEEELAWRCAEATQQLKTETGDTFLFRGQPYPRE